MNEMDQLYTVKQVAGILNVHPFTVNRWLLGGKIKGSKIGKSWQIKKSEVDYVIDNGLRKE